MINSLLTAVALLFALVGAGIGALARRRELTLLISGERLLRRLGGESAAKQTRTIWLIGAAVAYGAIIALTKRYAWFLLPIAAVLATRWLNARGRHQRLLKFEEQFEQAAGTLAGGMRAGQSLVQALAATEQEYGPPLGAELRTVLRQYQAGESLDSALAELEHRVVCPETAFFARAIAIQGRTGGSIAGVLTNLARIIRQRRLLRGEVRAKTGEARLTAIVLAILPPLLAAYMFFADRALLAPLVETPLGRGGLVYAAVSWLIGVFVISRMVGSVGGS